MSSSVMHRGGACLVKRGQRRPSDAQDSLTFPSARYKGCAGFLMLLIWNVDAWPSETTVDAINLHA